MSFILGMQDEGGFVSMLKCKVSDGGFATEEKFSITPLTVVSWMSFFFVFAGQAEHCHHIIGA